MNHAQLVSVITSHLRELPTVALDAILDLANAAGPTALVELVVQEVVNRHPDSLES